MTHFELGVDVGGTFTDFVLIRDRRDILLHKRLSTPQDPSVGVVAGILEMAQRDGFRPADLERIVHGTTVVANALIERKGQPTALLSSAGFRDVLEIGREVRYDIYDLGIENPQPLAPRYLRRELSERTLADGTVRTPVDADEVRGHARDLVAAGAQAVAVCLMHSYRNAAGEQAVGAILREEFPALRVTLSSEVAPEIREFERASTTVANAYVHPLVDHYMAKLERELAAIGFGGALYIMLSHGGLASVAFARKRPIQLVESGPAAGVEATAYLGRKRGWPDLLAFDMGGTTAKASLIDAGLPSYTMDTEVARIRRFKKGSGLPLKVPSVEMIEIGAGGGSIARLDAMRLLKVGPESAGAAPGPACYALGGAEPTVTDADVVLGYLNPDNFLGGRMRLDVEAARNAIHSRVAAPLGVDVVAAAAGIVALANENMATAARLHVAERGKDPQRYTLMAFGGAGPVHAYGVARALRLRRIIYPMGAGALSALGFLVAPAAQRLARSYVAPLGGIDWRLLRSLFDEMRAEAAAAMAQAGVQPADIRMTLSADMRYVGQGHELDVAFDAQVLTGEDAGALRAAFETAYFELFSLRLEALPVEVLNWRLACRGPGGEAPLSSWVPARSGGAQDARTGERRIYLPQAKDFAVAPVYDRYALAAGATFAGPAIVEERESTVVINGAARVEVDGYANLLVEPGD
jgi:N-methylhydantoinase A